MTSLPKNFKLQTKQINGKQTRKGQKTKKSGEKEKKEEIFPPCYSVESAVKEGSKYHYVAAARFD